MGSPPIPCKRKSKIREPLLIKSTLDQFVQVLGIRDWGVWNTPHDAHTLALKRMKTCKPLFAPPNAHMQRK
jgi:hypothetical protein